tara:strand:- start:921 stop:2129 length:1209 start_codon:yes stop_codon:yes gene_type:complete
MLIFLERETGILTSTISDKQETLRSEAIDALEQATSDDYHGTYFSYEIHDAEDIDIDDVGSYEEVGINSGYATWSVNFEFSGYSQSIPFSRSNTAELEKSIENTLENFDNTSYPVNYYFNTRWVEQGEKHYITTCEITFQFDESDVGDYIRFISQISAYRDSIDDADQVAEDAIEDLLERGVIERRELGTILSMIESNKIVELQFTDGDIEAEFSLSEPFLLFSYDSNKLPVSQGSPKDIFAEARRRTFEGLGDLSRSIYDDFLSSQSQMGLFRVNRRSTVEIFKPDARHVRSSLRGLSLNIPKIATFKQGKEEVYIDGPIYLRIDRDITEDDEQSQIYSQFINYLVKNMGYFLNQIKNLYNQNMEEILKSQPSFVPQKSDDEINESNGKSRKLSFVVRRRV